MTELAPYSDFLKMVMYHNCGGERLAGYIRSVGGDHYGDVPPQELLDFHYRVLDYGQEKDLAELPQDGSFRRLRLPRGQARARSPGGREDAALAGHRYRYSDRRHVQQVHARRHPRRGAGGLPRRRRWRDPFAQVVGDEAGQPAGRGRSDQADPGRWIGFRAAARMTRDGEQRWRRISARRPSCGCFGCCAELRGAHHGLARTLR